MTYRYTVRAFFEDQEVADEWVRWLQEGHCREVLSGGARRAEILQIEDANLSLIHISEPTRPY